MLEASRRNCDNSAISRFIGFSFTLCMDGNIAIHWQPSRSMVEAGVETFTESECPTILMDRLHVVDWSQERHSGLANPKQQLGASTEQRLTYISTIT